MTSLPRLCLILALACILPLGQSCNRTPIEVPPAASITKPDREQLGKVILDFYIDNPQTYRILPNTGQNAVAYHFVQTLYNQATAFIRLDLNSSTGNRWTQNKEWQVNILDSEDLKAYIIPGGHLFISKGLLKSLERENELFFILAFEASLMNENFLLRQMVAEYNTLNLHNIINGATQSNGFTVSKIAQDVSDFIFEENEVNEIDIFTIQTICETSLYKPDGVAEIINRNNENIWLNSRISTSNRINHINSLIGATDDCGDLRTTGAYQENVLNVLD